MSPVRVTRAIAAPGCPVSTLVPGTRNAAPAATTAQMAIRMAKTRQKVSLRRIRRRSTMVSASSDMAMLLDESGRDSAAGHHNGQWPGRNCGKQNRNGSQRCSSKAALGGPAEPRIFASPGGRKSCPSLFFVLLLGRFLALALERGAEDVAERRARVR